jgi:hypothetical protein
MVAENAGLSEAEVEAIGRVGLIPQTRLTRWSRTWWGSSRFPLGFATNFLIDGRELLCPHGDGRALGERGREQRG